MHLRPQTTGIAKLVARVDSERSTSLAIAQTGAPRGANTVFLIYIYIYIYIYKCYCGFWWRRASELDEFVTPDEDWLLLYKSLPALSP
jgi:hypothetical protein